MTVSFLPSNDEAKARGKAVKVLVEALELDGKDVLSITISTGRILTVHREGGNRVTYDMPFIWPKDTADVRA